MKEERRMEGRMEAWKPEPNILENKKLEKV